MGILQTLRFFPRSLRECTCFAYSMESVLSLFFCCTNSAALTKCSYRSDICHLPRSLKSKARKTMYLDKCLQLVYASVCPSTLNDSPPSHSARSRRHPPRQQSLYRIPTLPLDGDNCCDTHKYGVLSKAKHFPWRLCVSDMRPNTSGRENPRRTKPIRVTPAKYKLFLPRYLSVSVHTPHSGPS